MESNRVLRKSHRSTRKPEINGRDKVVEYSNKWFGFSEMKEADKLAAQLNERDGLKELYD